jgi:hypothetical protein
VPAVIGLQDSYVCLAVRTVSVLSCITFCMCSVLRSADRQQVARTCRMLKVGVCMVASCIARCGQCFCMVFFQGCGSKCLAIWLGVVLLVLWEEG